MSTHICNTIDDKKDPKISRSLVSQWNGEPMVWVSLSPLDTNNGALLLLKGGSTHHDNMSVY